jgi:hypothetical protein
MYVNFDSLVHVVRSYQLLAKSNEQRKAALHLVMGLVLIN